MTDEITLTRQQVSTAIFEYLIKRGKTPNRKYGVQIENRCGNLLYNIKLTQLKTDMSACKKAIFKLYDRLDGPISVKRLLDNLKNRYTYSCIQEAARELFYSGEVTFTFMDDL